MSIGIRESRGRMDRLYELETWGSMSWQHA
jgi:hypothetical protein